MNPAVLYLTKTGRPVKIRRESQTLPGHVIVTESRADTVVTQCLPLAELVPLTLAELQHRAAPRGWAVAQTATGYSAMRWGMVRELPDLCAAALFLAAAGVR
ncbi:hypothetical protein [uncultured Sphaerotilus sp.]|uniref:hypothetical protein n=1 Tax=uncultured Sphaerotilus sp. TaxID=474984 RepID=UPI0030CA2BC5